MSRERRLVVLVAVSFGLMMLSVVAFRTITEIVSRRIEKDAESIGQNALVAAEALVSARADLNKLVSAMGTLRVSDGSVVADQNLASQLAVARRDASANWAKYISLPFYPGERKLVERVGPYLTTATQAVDEIDARLRRRDRAGTLGVVDGRALPAIQRADEGFGQLIQLNGREARNAAARIVASKRPWGLLPEFMGAFFAIAAALFGVRLLNQYLAWARERSTELENFAGRVAHDIRGPLGSASLALDLAQRAQKVDPKTRDLLTRASRTMDRIATLVDGLLVFATSGGYVVPGTFGEPRTSTAEVLNGVMEDLNVEAEAKNVEIQYTPPDPALAVACSAGVLISMTTNLVSNALKFMGDAVLRRITISVREVGHDAEIAVSDTGPGIAPELLGKVFDPYVRGDSKAPGLGLGLATVRKLAEGHGGRVRVESTPGHGSTFSFTIPTAQHG